MWEGLEDSPFPFTMFQSVVFIDKQKLYAYLRYRGIIADKESIRLHGDGCIKIDVRNSLVHAETMNIIIKELEMINTHIDAVHFYANEDKVYGIDIGFSCSVKFAKNNE